MDERALKNLREHFDWHSRDKGINVVQLNTGNTLKHELMKCRVAYTLLKQGFTIITEAKLKNGKGRPDIVVLDTVEPIAYEIMDSETITSITEKKSYYGMRIICVPIDFKGEINL